MRSTAFWCLLAACSSGGGNTITGGWLGSTHDTSGLDAKYGASPNGGKAAADPKLAARLAYTNPGGMWMPQQMALPGHVDTFKKLGAALDAKTLADPLASPLGAIVALNGCTGSFVSADGLIATNHHCVQTALKVNSTKDDNLVANGFLAKTRAEERSAGPAARVWVARAFKDVSKEMRDGLDAIKDPAARHDELEKREKQLIAACERERPEVRCKVSSFFRGAMYQLIENIEIRDVRLVYAPARSIGNYGGEEDNWAWPRHTGDFALLRAYVGKTGKPATYATENVPYRPKQVLTVATGGVKAGDLVMVTGYPARTSRTKTASEIRHYVEWYLPYAIAYYKERYAVAKGLAGGGESETSIKATVEQQRVQNGLENMQGQLDGLTKSDLLARKNDVDKQIKDWAAKQGRESQKAALDKLEQVVAEEARIARAEYDREQVFGGSQLLKTALSLVRWAEEREKKDADRKFGYQERDLLDAQSKQKQFLRDYDRTLDRAIFRLALVRALQLPDAERPWLALLLDTKPNQKITEAVIDKTLDTWYGTNWLESEKLRLELLAKGTPAQLKTQRDPFLKAALRVWATYKAEEKKDDTLAGEMLVLAPVYADAMREVLGGQLAPDANGTLRITYGTIKSLKPESKDAVDRAFTVASEIPAKNTGTGDFNAPKALLDAIKAKQYGTYADPALGNELPVDFLSDLDITGGNSGSPTLNDRGQFVGLVFDGTIAGVASNVVFNGATTRAIHVDARYMLWVLDLIDGADHLVKEMGVQPKLP